MFYIIKFENSRVKFVTKISSVSSGLIFWDFNKSNAKQFSMTDIRSIQLNQRLTTALKAEKAIRCDVGNVPTSPPTLTGPTGAVKKTSYKYHRGDHRKESNPGRTYVTYRGHYLKEVSTDDTASNSVVTWTKNRRQALDVTNITHMKALINAKYPKAKFVKE